MIKSYYKLLGVQPGLPTWERQDLLYKVLSKLKSVYGDPIPVEFKLAFATLLDDDETDRYDSLFEWAEACEAVDFGQHAAVNAERARAHHFEVEFVSDTKLRFRNTGVPNPPPPPPPEELLRTAESPRRPASAHAEPSEDVSRVHNYFDLYRVPIDTPDAQFDVVMKTAIKEVAQDYGDNAVLPEAFGSAVNVLRDPELRSTYKAMLQAAESGEGVPIDNDPGPIQGFARQTHFSVELIAEGRAVIRNLGIPSPPLPSEVPRQPVSAPTRKDEHGRVNGVIPPLVLGTRSFTYHFVRRTLIHAAVIQDRKSHSVKTTWQNDDGTRFAINDFIGGNYANHLFVVGAQYVHLVLQDEVTRDQFFCCYAVVDKGLLSILQSADGLYRMFPWEIDHMEFSRRFSGYRLVPDYFGTGGISSDATIAAAVKYVRETHYWITLAICNGNATPSEIRNLTVPSIAMGLRCFGFKPRWLRKYGIDTKNV